MHSNSDPTATAIVDQMMEKDFFSQWLGIERLEERPGYCRLRMSVREEMCNGFAIAHGGIAYSLADSALAFASNSKGRHAVSVDTTITHIKPLYAGDVIIATAQEVTVSNRMGVYEVRIEIEGQGVVSLFKGTVFRKETSWDIKASI